MMSVIVEREANTLNQDPHKLITPMLEMTAINNTQCRVFVLK